MKCGLCGSGVSATEKFKKLKDGTHNRHVYYGCTKAKDKNCKNQYINEIELIKQLQKLVDNMDLNKSGVKTKIQNEVKRFKKFQQTLLGNNTDVKVEDVDVRNYVKFILKEGEADEKREFLNNLESGLVLEGREIRLTKK